jgi:hypothetical protein
MGSTIAVDVESEQLRFRQAEVAKPASPEAVLV